MTTREYREPNQAIAYLTDAAVMGKIGMDAGLKNRLLGEAYFLRAFYYFDLVNAFGDVPLLLKPLADVRRSLQRRQERTEGGCLYADQRGPRTGRRRFCPPAKYSDARDKWRASRGAAIAMQAKVALYNQKWADVISIVTSSKHSVTTT
jgi:hypothetical protein